VVYDMQGRHGRSLEALLKAIEIDPQHADALGRASVKYGDRGDVVNEYRMANAAFEAAPADSRFARAEHPGVATGLAQLRKKLGKAAPPGG
jgi:hypothetical protein